MTKGYTSSYPDIFQLELSVYNSLIMDVRETFSDIFCPLPCSLFVGLGLRVSVRHVISQALCALFQNQGRYRDFLPHKK